jgi:hypothetical protein
MPAVVALGVFYGTLLLVLMLLNRRDRRDAELRGTIGAGVPRELREMVSVSVAVSLWSARAQVMLDMQDCETGETWQVIERLGPRLPRGTTLSVIVPAPAAGCRTSIRVVGPGAIPDGYGRVQALTARGA